MSKAKKTELKPAEKFPKLHKMIVQLQKDKEKILEKSKGLHAKRDKLLEKIQPMEAELREVNKAIAKIERPHLGNLDNEISALAKAMGGKSMSDVDTPPATE